MSEIEPYTVYVDDSGTDSHSRIVVAAFCVSQVRKWKKFEAAWRAVGKDAGFDHFHMTEFAACRKEKWCRECIAGKTGQSDHPWREWSTTKRKRVLDTLITIICRYTEHGCGIAFAKDDLQKYVISSHLTNLVPGSVGQECFTFAVQTCGGELAKWRAKQGMTPPLKFVFDLSPEAQKQEIAQVFLAASKRPRLQDGVEQWFEISENGISYENRKNTVQLLSADMLAWVTAKIRAAQLFGKGWSKDVKMIAYRFVASGKLDIGYNTEEQLRNWHDREVAYHLATKSQAGESHGGGILSADQQT
jgi:hypothetical protein